MPLWIFTLDITIWLGKDAHWQVGSDHAGIATQMVVENNLAKKDITRNELGREKFLEISLFQVHF